MASIFDAGTSHCNQTPVVSIPITVITDGLLVEAGNIYLLPPGKEAIITSGKLFLKDRSPARELTFPIDEFFRSLAQDFGPRPIGVILAGTGTDGSRGIQDMHAAGVWNRCRRFGSRTRQTFQGRLKNTFATRK